MGQCTNDVTIPEPLVEICNGKYISTKCSIHENALVELGLTADSSVETIINTMYTAIVSMQQRITALEAL